MKISIITVCYNSEYTIQNTINSVLNQSYSDIEYIIVDGNSTDNTKSIITSYANKISCFISEPDHGIYHAMNKGIRMATGDIVGMLNADDFFTNQEVVQRIVKEFENKDIDAVYGDVQFVNPENINRIVRYYSSSKFKPNKFKYGFMPAHPSFYVKKDLFEKLGYYKEDYLIASDYELLIRFLFKGNLLYKYIERPLVTMRSGGISNKSLKNRFILNKEIMRACKENGIKTNYINIYSKYFRKINELIGNR
ncbi:MAG TPA: glycosyl transferase [Bacteroidales bacterium]|nr:glycosyl transferase [Bacteroidales bacterium]